MSRVFTLKLSDRRRETKLISVLWGGVDLPNSYVIVQHSSFITYNGPRPYINLLSFNIHPIRTSNPYANQAYMRSMIWMKPLQEALHRA